MVRTRGLFIVLLFGLVGCVANQVQNDGDERKTLLHKKMAQRLIDVEKDPKLLHLLNEYAFTRAVRCQRCHEPEGRSKTLDMPFLAGQNPYYSIDQFLRYADGRRQDFTMRTLTAGMSDDDMINIAIYYARMPVRPAGGGTIQQRNVGEKIYKEKCILCHGPDGRGKEQFPSLAGQQRQYMVKMLKQFRLGADGGINNPVMTPIAAALDENQMISVAAYVANLP